MSTARTPRLKSLPAATTGPSPAEPSLTPSGGGAPKGVGRQAVLTTLHPDPHMVTVAGIRPGLSVRGLGRHQVPTADWLCACGHHERARGRHAVTELTTRAHVGQCPHAGPAANRSAA